jgi:hypothetical protein
MERASTYTLVEFVPWTNPVSRDSEIHHRTQVGWSPEESVDSELRSLRARGRAVQRNSS